MDTRTANMVLVLGIITLLTLNLNGADGQTCEIPSQFQGEWFSLERGKNVDTTINADLFQNQFFDGICVDLWNDTSSLDAEGNFNSKILLFSETSACYECYYMWYRTPNIVQYQQSECRTYPDGVIPSLEVVCSGIREFTEMWTFFRKALEVVNCKNTFEGTYHFTYEMNIGGSGPCDSPNSLIVACQEPGSPYVDNQVFKMNFAKCPELASSGNKQIKFQCMGMWKDPAGNVWSGIMDLGAVVNKERYRCLLTRYDQEEEDNQLRYSMSWWSECSSLKSPYEGPIRLRLKPALANYQIIIAEPKCNFPEDYIGDWYHITEYEVNVKINATHMYFNQQYDLYKYKETYFVCLMNTAGRYLTMGLTVGSCDMDYVCFDMRPRQNSLIRWRISKPYRLIVKDLGHVDVEMFMMRQACDWNSFTIDRNDFAWNYNTFLQNPPVPMACPLRGRFRFTQSGPETELFRTRIFGMTRYPRHHIDCKDYSSLFYSCDLNPSIINIDYEYCETLDHTGRPIGEYDMPDWILTCVDYWDEDFHHYMITWDPYDALSQFRCWSYERVDWRHYRLSRATNAACKPTMTPSSADPQLGSSLALELEEFERQYDDCAQFYTDGSLDPEQSYVKQDQVDFNAPAPAARLSPSNALGLCLAVLAGGWAQRGHN